MAANPGKTSTPGMTIATPPARRSCGTGALYVRTDSSGRESWYGHWRVDGQQIKRCIDGLTRTRAEAELREYVGVTGTEHGPLPLSRIGEVDVAAAPKAIILRVADHLAGAALPVRPEPESPLRERMIAHVRKYVDERAHAQARQERSA